MDASHRKPIHDSLNSMQAFLPLLQHINLPSSGHGFAEAYRHWMEALSKNPGMLAELQQRYVDAHAQIFARVNETPDSRIVDKRFAAPEWQANPAIRYLVESYLTTSQFFLEAIESSALDEDDKKRLSFFAKQYLDAVAPSNYLLTNPEAIKAAVESKGETLRAGLENLQADMQKGHISMTDETAFRIGENIAATPGAVIFENELIQLIQYAPSTPQVHLRPLLIVPPCINKYYVLDLRPENSFVRYAVAQGFTVFLISWRNIQEAQAQLTWDDYLANGVVKAIDVTRLATQVEKINILGFCVGGTLVASALAVLRRMRHDVIESVTLLTTFLDFSEAGDITAYIDQAFIQEREREVGQGGIVPGSELAFAFSSLRANDLVWNYVVNNYLKGLQPPPFDLLYWNSDSTNLPGPWYAYYLRNTYYENNLIKPDKLTMCGQPVDLSYIDMPAFVLAAREDHIVPWQTAFSSATYLGGEVEFVLGASGHIAGVVNPASSNKRCYWVGGEIGHDADQWFERTREIAGSWWPYWVDWLRQYSGRQIPARQISAQGSFKPIEPAPGRYVKEKTSPVKR